MSSELMICCLMNKIIDFLELPQQWEDLAGAVHPELYRNKLDQ